MGVMYYQCIVHVIRMRLKYRWDVCETRVRCIVRTVDKKYIIVCGLENVCNTCEMHWVRCITNVLSM